MDKIKEMIKKLQAEGKSISEIAGEVAKLAEAKELANDAAKLAEVIKTEIKAIEVAAEIEKNEKKDADEKAFKAKVDEAVKETLKAMSAVDPQANEKKEIKFFNHLSGKFEKSKGLSDSKKAMADLLRATASHDRESVKSINREIEADWKEKADRMGMPDMKTALYSDATTGSYLIPSEVAMEIIEVAYTQSVIANLCNKSAVIYNDKIMPLILGGDLAFLANEAAQIGDKTPTISNPTLETAQFGGIYLANNELLRMKGEALVSAFMSQAASKTREFLDLNLVMASKDGSGADPIDGMLFDANISYVTAVAAATGFTYDDVIAALINDIGGKIPTANISFLSNRKIRRKAGLLNDASGQPYFREFIQTGRFAPEGINWVENTMIPSTYTRSSQEPLTGSSDVILCGDFSKVYVAIDNLRIAESEHFKFDYNQYAWRLLGRAGQRVISGSGTAGKVLTSIEITN